MDVTLNSLPGHATERFPDIGKSVRNVLCETFLLRCKKYNLSHLVHMFSKARCYIANYIIGSLRELMSSMILYNLMADLATAVKK